MADNGKSEAIREPREAEDIANAMHQVRNEKDAAAVHEELVRSKAGGYIPVTSEEKHQSRALNLKFDLFVLPFCVMIYLLNGLDRSNLGNAQVGGFTKDLGIPADTINTATSLFFCTVGAYPFYTRDGWKG
jgi:hypothetical protein